MDESEFDAFYTASFRRLVGQVYAMIGDRDEAQECVQEAFVRAWSHRAKIAKDLAPEAWVRTTAYRLAVSRWRRKKRGERPPDRAVQGVKNQTAPDESRVALMAALQHLPEEQRRAIVLHHLCDLPVKDVAAEVGVPEGTIKARLSRGRTALAALLGDEPTTGPAAGAAEGASHA
jgi:RNA polymerase sigma-70 factor (ECF subfamily)